MLNSQPFVYITDDPFFQSAYRARSMCWLHDKTLHFGFLLPVGILALINIFCFITNMSEIICRKKVVSGFQILMYRLTPTQTHCLTLRLFSQVRSTAKNRSKKEDFFIALSICVVMGLAWVFGFLMMISEDITYKTAMSWLFNLLNSTQVG